MRGDAERLPGDWPRRRGFGDNAPMYVIVIGWLYVTLLMALVEHSVIAGILTFVFYGLAPVALLVFITGGPTRRRRLRRVAEEQAHEENRGDAERDQ